MCLNEYDKFAKWKTKQTKNKVPKYALVLHTWFGVYLMFVWSIDNIFRLLYLCFSMQKEVRLCIWRSFYQKEVAFFIKSKMHAPFCQRGIYWFTLMLGKTLNNRCLALNTGNHFHGHLLSKWHNGDCYTNKDAIAFHI